MPDTFVKCLDLTKRFDQIVAVNGLSFEVFSGSIFGLLGPNGAGKTTTIRMLCGMVKPTSGTYSVCGLAMDEGGHENRRLIGLLTEYPGHFEQLTAEQNLMFYARMNLIDQNRARSKIAELLTLFDLENRKDDLVGSFSKGMKQKLAIARCLLHDPKVLFLDEPTAGLDPESSKEIRDKIEEMRDEGRAIILCTHNLDEAERLCDEVALIKTDLIALDSPANLKRKAFKNTIEITFAGKAAAYLDLLKDKGFADSQLINENSISIAISDIPFDNPIIIKELVGAGADIVFVTEVSHSLEDAYLNLMDK
ncbi:MAG: ABC transporter ATP-binding protein [Actinobacteria bacterium]|nr:ABC transporter ATP-binding protein [Actinomycetota bacterium]